MARGAYRQTAEAEPIRGWGGAGGRSKELENQSSTQCDAGRISGEVAVGVYARCVIEIIVLPGSHTPVQADENKLGPLNSCTKGERMRGWFESLQTRAEFAGSEVHVNKGFAPETTNDGKQYIVSGRGSSSWRIDWARLLRRRWHFTITGLPVSSDNFTMTAGTVYDQPFTLDCLSPLHRRGGTHCVSCEYPRLTGIPIYDHGSRTTEWSCYCITAGGKCMKRYQKTPTSRLPSRLCKSRGPPDHHRALPEVINPYRAEMRCFQEWA